MFATITNVHKSFVWGCKSIKVCRGAALLAIGSSMAWGKMFTTSTIRNCNGIDYELWSQNNRGNVSMKITGGSTNPNGGRLRPRDGYGECSFRAGKNGDTGTTTTKSIEI